MARVPVAKGVFTWPSDAPRLIGSRCTACGIVTFPIQDSCPRCPSTEMAEHLVAHRLGPLALDPDPALLRHNARFVACDASARSGTGWGWGREASAGTGTTSTEGDNL